MLRPRTRPLIAIACGGTGGHLFPGLAVADVFVQRGGAVMLLISPKEIDQQGVKAAAGLEIVPLPAVALTRGRVGAFISGCWHAFRAAKAAFRPRPPQAVLAMGGFTSAPPVMAGKTMGAASFLHEGNTIPGKANRWLSPVVDLAFVNFPSTAARLHTQQVITTGMPVRSQFQPADPASCRTALGLRPDRPVLLVMGGSQGASRINELVLQALPILRQTAPELQYLHLTGPGLAHEAQALYAAHGSTCAVFPFLTEMELALGAATLAISRAGASSLAELAAMRLPAILIPYPFAADDHQYYNARAVAGAGGAFLLEQNEATVDKLVGLIATLTRNTAARTAMARELERWHAPHAAEMIANQMIRVMALKNLWPQALSGPMGTAAPAPGPLQSASA